MPMDGVEDNGKRKAGVAGDRAMRMAGLRDRTKNFALRVVKLYSALPKSVEAQVMGKQLLR